MSVADIMIPEVHFLNPDDTVRAAARMMAELDTGALPVGGPMDLKGILTDRDVLIRVVAQGRDPSATRVAEVMSADVATCRMSDAAESVLIEMERRQIRRMPVLDGDGRVVGMVGLRALLQPPAACPPGSTSLAALR